jgi:hypothetical protein
MNNTLKTMLLPMLLLAGCTKDIEVDLPEYDSKLYVYAVSPVFDKMRVTVGRSVPIKEYSNYNTDFTVSNATVLLYENDKAAIQLIYDVNSKQYVSPVDIPLSATYRIEVSAPGYESVSASAALPGFVIIEDIQNKIVNSDSFGSTEFTIRFTDPPSKGDFYTIDFTSAYELRDAAGRPGIPGQPEGEGGERFGYDYGCLSSTDPAIEDVANKDPFTTEVCLPSKNMLISDELFNGQARTIKFKLPKYYSDQYVDTVDGVQVVTYSQVKLKHVSEEYVKYLRSYRKVRDNSGNPFVEPVNVYTNIVNGYGVFAPVSEDVRQIGQ